MKILYLITKSNWGGAQRHVHDLSLAMKKRGYDVAVALGGSGALAQRLEEATVDIDRIESLGRDVSFKADMRSFAETFSILRRRKPDILHLHSPKAAGLGALAGRVLRVPRIIYTVHGWAFNEDRPAHQKALIMLFSWITMLLCHKVIVISQREYEQSLRFPFVAKKLALVHLGIHPPVFLSNEGARHEMAKLLGVKVADYSKKIVIGTIAELHPNKGLRYLIEAMESVCREHPHAICAIIGGGQDESALRELIKERGLEQKVLLLGFVNHASEYLKSFSLFALPSIKEGLPYVIFEAGSAATPVVATAVGGIPEVVEDMSSGVLVQPKNSRELAHAISFMIEHPVERKKYGAALKARVLADFSLEKMIEGTEAVYKSN